MSHRDDEVIIKRGNKRVKMSKARYQEMLKEIEARQHEYDKYHGNSALMYDPEAPFPQTFNARASVRWAPSGASNGSVQGSGSAKSLSDEDFLSIMKKVKK
jgi:hypothetical protein